MASAVAWTKVRSIVYHSYHMLSELEMIYMNCYTLLLVTYYNNSIKIPYTVIYSCKRCRCYYGHLFLSSWM